MKRIGKQYRFVYPDYGTPDGYPEHTAHRGQIVVIEERGLGDFAGYYRVVATDGWQGWAREDELNPLQPRKGNIIRPLHRPHINELFKVESMGEKSVTLRRLSDNAVIPNCPREWLG